MQTSAAAPEQISEAAQRLAAGDIHHASALFPQVSPLIFSQSYTEAFRSLLYVLIIITILSAFAVFAFLGRTSPKTRQHHAEVSGADIPAADQSNA